MAEDDYTPEQLARFASHETPEQMIFTKLGDPLPRCLPDGRVVIRSDLISTLDDNEATDWIDNLSEDIAKQILFAPKDIT